MLVVTVQDGDYIMLNDDVKVRFMKAGSVYKLAVDAPKETRVRRKSTYEMETQQKDGAYKASKKRYVPHNRQATV